MLIGKNDAGHTDSAAQQREETAAEMPDTAKQLEDALRTADGVGEVKVVIYYAGSASDVIAKDKSEESGDERKRFEEKVVLGSDNRPVVLKRSSPEIKGVLIIAQGGGNAAVRARLICAAQALLGVDAHKIEVLKMKQGGS